MHRVEATRRLSVRARFIFLVLPLILMLLPEHGFPQQQEPYYLRDRGTGIPTSIFGTYVRKGELLIYPFYEYYRDGNFEYEPFEFGYESRQEFRGRYRAHEGLIFIGYGVSDRLALEFEAGVISADFTKSAQDLTPLPMHIEESGLSDVEGQVRWRWNFENESKPEFFNYFEYVLPTGEKNSLIGTSDWELKLGIGLIKGFRWGTLTFRFAAEYSEAEKRVEPGEYAVEYLRRISDRFRFFAMVEGSQDEVSVVPEIQWHFSDKIFLKANSGFAVSSKATDFSPEVGVVFAFY